MHEIEHTTKDGNEISVLPGATVSATERSSGLDTIQTSLKTIRQQRVKRLTRIVGFLVVSLVAISIIYGINLALINSGHLWAPSYSWVLYIPLFSWYLRALWLTSRGTPLETQAIRQITNSSDLDAFGPLLESPGFSDRKLRKDVTAALIEMLPRLTENEAARLTSRQISVIASILQYFDNHLSMNYYSNELVIAILRSADLFPYRRVLRQVERLTGYRGNSADAESIRAAARESLPLLQQRIKEINEVKTLLSPSEPSENVTLVRPAGVSDEDNKTLLRASKSTPAGDVSEEQPVMRVPVTDSKDHDETILLRPQ